MSLPVCVYVKVSQETARILMDHNFDLKERGKIFVKGKGEMTTYFLEGEVRGGIRLWFSPFSIHHFFSQEPNIYIFLVHTLVMPMHICTVFPLQLLFVLYIVSF